MFFCRVSACESLVCPYLTYFDLVLREIGILVTTLAVAPPVNHIAALVGKSCNDFSAVSCMCHLLSGLCIFDS